jgi:hypothetical protein
MADLVADSVPAYRLKTSQVEDFLVDTFGGSPERFQVKVEHLAVLVDQ